MACPAVRQDRTGLQMRGRTFSVWDRAEVLIGERSGRESVRGYPGIGEDAAFDVGWDGFGRLLRPGPLFATMDHRGKRAAQRGVATVVPPKNAVRVL